MATTTSASRLKATPKSDGGRTSSSSSKQQRNANVYSAAAMAARRLDFPSEEDGKNKHQEGLAIDVHSNAEKEKTPVAASPRHTEDNNKDKNNTKVRRKKVVAISAELQKCRTAEASSLPPTPLSVATTPTAASPTAKKVSTKKKLSGEKHYMKPTAVAVTNTATLKTPVKSKASTSSSGAKTPQTKTPSAVKTPLTKITASNNDNDGKTPQSKSAKRTEYLYKDGVRRHAKSRGLTDKEEAKQLQKRQEEYEIQRDQCTFRPQLDWRSTLRSPNPPASSSSGVKTESPDIALLESKLNKLRADKIQLAKKLQSTTAATATATTPREKKRETITSTTATTTTTPRSRKEDVVMSPVVRAATNAAEKKVDVLNDGMLVNDTLEEEHEEEIVMKATNAVDVMRGNDVLNDGMLVNDTVEEGEEDARDDHVGGKEEMGHSVGGMVDVSTDIHLNESTIDHDDDYDEEEEEEEEMNVSQQKDEGINYSTICSTDVHLHDSTLEHDGEESEQTSLLVKTFVEISKAQGDAAALEYAADQLDESRHNTKNKHDDISLTKYSTTAQYEGETPISPEAKLKAATPPHGIINSNYNTSPSSMEYNKLIRDVCSELELTKSQIQYMSSEKMALEATIRELNDALNEEEVFKSTFQDQIAELKELLKQERRQDGNHHQLSSGTEEEKSSPKEEKVVIPLQNQIAELKELLERSKEEQASFCAALQQKEEEIQALNQSKQAIEDSLRKASQQIEESKQELEDSLHTALKEKDAEIQAVNRSRRDLEKELEAAKICISTLEEGEKNMIESKQRLEEELQAAKVCISTLEEEETKDFGNKLDVYKVQIDRLKQNVKTLKDKLQEKDGYVDLESEARAKLEDRISDLMKDKEAELKMKEENVRVWKEKLQENGRIIKIEMGARKALEDEVRSLIEKVAHLEKKEQEDKLEIVANEIEVANLKQQRDKLQEENKAAKLMISQLEKEESEMITHDDDIVMKLESAEDTIVQLKLVRDERDKLLEENKAANLIISQLEKEETEIITHDADSATKLELARDEIVQLKSARDDLLRKVEELEMNLAEATTLMRDELELMKREKEKEKEKESAHDDGDLVLETNNDDERDEAIQDLKAKLEHANIQISKLITEKESLEHTMQDGVQQLSRSLSKEEGEEESIAIESSEKDEIMSKTNPDKKRIKKTLHAPHPKKWRSILAVPSNRDTPALVEEEDAEQQQQQDDKSNMSSVIDIDAMCLVNAACSVPNEYQSDHASYHIRRPRYFTEDGSFGIGGDSGNRDIAIDDNDCGFEEQYGRRSQKLYSQTFTATNPDSVEVITRIEADRSVLVLHGKSSVLHWVPCDDEDGAAHDGGDGGGLMKDNIGTGDEKKKSDDADDDEHTTVLKPSRRRQRRRLTGWKSIHYVDGINETLGSRTFVDDTGNQCEYSLETIFEEALASREMYCMSVLSAASVLQETTLRDSYRQAVETVASSSVKQGDTPVSPNLEKNLDKSPAEKKDLNGAVNQGPKSIVTHAALPPSTRGTVVQKKISFADDISADVENSGAMDLYWTLLVLIATFFFNTFWSVCVRLPLKVASWTFILVAVGASIAVLYAYFVGDEVSSAMNAGIKVGYNQAGIC